MRVLLLPMILGVSAIQIYAQYIHPFDVHIIGPKTIHTDSFDYILRIEPIPNTHCKSNPKISDRTAFFTDFNASKTEDFDGLISLINNFDFGISRTPPGSRSNFISVLSGDFLASPALQLIPLIKKNIIGHEPKLSFREMNKFISHTDEIPESYFISASKDSALLNDSLIASTFPPDLFAPSFIQPENPLEKQNKHAKYDSQDAEKSKNHLNSFTVQNLAPGYPDYSPSSHIPKIIDFDIFENRSGEERSIATLQNSEDYYSSNKKFRRAAWLSAQAYDWEINDFDENATGANPLLTSFDGNLNADSSTKFKLNVIANGGIDSLAVLAWGHIGGNALKDMSSPGFKFLTHNKNNTTLSTGNVTSSFDLRLTDAETGQTGIESWLNDPSWHSWSVVASDSGTNREFFLTYDYNPLGYSAVPEPSTYFMTGAIFGLLGFNRESRSAAKRILHNVFLKFPLKKYTPDIQKKVS
jgi:hypothetical protein